jgi:hypothetical protein
MINRRAQPATTGSMVRAQPRTDSGTMNFSVRFGGMICTESDFSAWQVEASTNRAVADVPGASFTVAVAWSLRVAGLPMRAPALRSWTPGKPVSEQGLDDLLVNCRKAYWCPAAPDPRSACTSSAAAWQPATAGAGTGTGCEGLAGLVDGLVGAEELAAVVGEELTDTDTLGLDGLTEDGAVLEAGAAEVIGAGAAESFVAGPQAAVSAMVADSSSASRRLVDTWYAAFSEICMTALVKPF